MIDKNQYIFEFELFKNSLHDMKFKIEEKCYNHELFKRREV